MTQKWPLVRLLSMARQVPASQQNASASPIDASKRHCSYDGAQMQIGCANHWFKMSGIPMIRTASGTRDKNEQQRCGSHDAAKVRRVQPFLTAVWFEPYLAGGVGVLTACSIAAVCAG